MISFEPTQIVESAARPGVSFQVRRLNKFERIKREAKLLTARERCAELFARLKELAGPGGEPLPGKVGEHSRANNELGIILVGEIQPIYLRFGLLAVNGYEIAGQPATVETFIESGEDALLEEAYAACVAASDLGADQEKNLSSAGTSPEAADGQPTPTTAIAAAE